jgi:hypothetical protein
MVAKKMNMAILRTDNSYTILKRKEYDKGLVMSKKNLNRHVN